MVSTARRRARFAALRMATFGVRKQIRDLSVTVKLDDFIAVSSAMELSRFPEVSIGARISKSGQAMPATGDLQGIQSPVSTKDPAGKVDIVVDERMGD